MSERKTATYLFEGLGFPVVLANAPWKKVFGEWALDINMKKLQEEVLYSLIHKVTPLTGDQLRFIRKFLEMTSLTFGKLFGVSHVAVVKWESGKSQISPATELCIRLYVMDHFLPKDKEFRSFYHEMSIEKLAKSRKKLPSTPLRIDAKPRRRIAKKRT